MTFGQIRKDLVSGKLSLIDVSNQYSENIHMAMNYFMSTKILTQEDMDEVKNLIMILLDYYTYSPDGEVLVSDHEYDKLMTHYINNGGSLIYLSDYLSSQWEFVKHESPGIVGTIKKIYSFDELCIYWEKTCPHMNSRMFWIAPKFDGISAAVKITRKGGETQIALGVTRNDGVQGQNITTVIMNSKNGPGLPSIYGLHLKEGQSMWIKTELVITTTDFEKLNEERKRNGDRLYANRRSATSGIVNSPKNINYMRFITVIPLAIHDMTTDEISYEPLDAKRITATGVEDLAENVMKMLETIRSSDYPIRTDGVVIYPIGTDIIPNYDDIMSSAIAYKVNNEQNYTHIDFGYVSVGRLGNAIPMLRVFPVEVNETTVTDVSLGSFDKFAGMDLHEGEKVMIYSAGNVIPQVALPKHREYHPGAKILKIKKRCPFCGEKLTRYINSYRCENPTCPRVSSGKIANFVIKMGADGVSDRTIEDLVGLGLITDIPDIFTLKVDDIARIEGYGEASAKHIVEEFEKIRTKETEISSLLGALGIHGISDKKCKILIKAMDFHKMLKRVRKKDRELIWDLMDMEGVAEKTSVIFVEFLRDNLELIEELLDIMNIVQDIQYKGNVVFTGFRDNDLAKQFNDIGYEVSSNVNSDTVAVIDVSYTHDSTKCKAAQRKGISIVHKTDVDKVLQGLSGHNY